MMVKFHNKWYKMDIVVSYLEYIMVKTKHSWYLCGKHINAMAHEQKTNKQKKHAFVLFPSTSFNYFMKMNYFI